jgi:thiol-disulfide isomerase/thioredoxin
MKLPGLLIAASTGLALGLAADAQAEELETVTADALHALIDANAGEVVVVNFWATWCPPCLREFPDIISVYKEYAERGLTILAVSMNDAEEAEDIDAFLEEFAPPFPVYRAASVDTEFFEGVLDPWYGEMPMTLVFDADGTMVHAHKKPLTYDELVSDLTPLLPEGAR